MIYVFKDNGVVVYQTTKPPGAEQVVELPRMVPTPHKDGYVPKLRADFETGRVWFDLVETPDGARARIIAAIEAHDKSPAVNSFTVGGLGMWLDREQRTSLARTIALAAEAGDATFSMWSPASPGVPPAKFDIPIGMAGPMLDALEIYAKTTYNVTQGHIAAVYTLGTIAEIEAYDYTAGYPPQLEFNL